MITVCLTVYVLDLARRAIEHQFRLCVVPVGVIGTSADDIIRELQALGSLVICLPVLLPLEMVTGNTAQLGQSVSLCLDDAKRRLGPSQLSALRVLTELPKHPAIATHVDNHLSFTENALCASSAYLRIECMAMHMGQTVPNSVDIVHGFSNFRCDTPLLRAQNWFPESSPPAARNPLWYVIRYVEPSDKTYCVQIVEYMRRRCDGVLVESAEHRTFLVTEAFFQQYFSLFRQEPFQPHCSYFLDGAVSEVVSLLTETSEPFTTSVSLAIASENENETPLFALNLLRTRLLNSMLHPTNHSQHVLPVSDNRLALLLASMWGFLRIRYVRKSVHAPDNAPRQVPKPFIQRQRIESMYTRTRQMAFSMAEDSKLVFAPPAL